MADGYGEIRAAAGFVPLVALGQDDGSGAAVATGRTRPLPTMAVAVAARSTALAGEVAVSGPVGPFVPEAGRMVWITLAGAWTGRVAVLRSIDGGTTRLPLSAGGLPWGVYDGPANEPVVADPDPAATYYLDVTIGSGRLVYRVAQ